MAMEYTYMKFKLDEDDDGVWLPVYVGLEAGVRRRPSTTLQRLETIRYRSRLVIAVRDQAPGCESSMFIFATAPRCPCFVSIVSMCRVIVDDGVDHD